MSDPDPRDILPAQRVADRAAKAMWEGDAASKWAGFELLSVGEGRAKLGVTVQAHHVNGHGICHGGITFMLADSAFAFACNSRNEATVAQHNSISYLAPARLGDQLIAEAEEVVMSGRSGLTDVRVINQDGVVIAEFRGASRSIGGTVYSEESDA